MTARVLLFVSAMLVLVAAASGVPVMGPVTITAPGTYELQADISGAGANAAIEVLASDVVIEGNGHAILGAGSLAGVLVQGGDGVAERVVVRNVSVENWQHGVHAIGVSGLVLDHVTARRNGDHGIYLFSVTKATVQDCTASENRGSGVVLSDVSHSNVVRNTTANGNDHNGLMLIASNENRLLGNTIRDNGAYGIDCYLAKENEITDNLFVNANNTHLEEFDRNTWSLSASTGPNIVGGPQRGGNYWGAPDGSGFSDQALDADADGFADTPYTLGEGNVDALPLTAVDGAAPATPVPGFGAAAALVVLAVLVVLWRR